MIEGDDFSDELMDLPPVTWLSELMRPLAILAILGGVVMGFGSLVSQVHIEAVTCNTAQVHSPDPVIRKKATALCKSQAADQMAGSMAMEAKNILN